MAKKLFICSDIHGFYKEWMSALKERGYDKENPNHIIIVCGDLLDRGSQANQCLNFVNSLPDDRKILIRGNHELLMDDILYKKRYFDPWDYSNGTVNTIEQVTDISQVYDGTCDGWEVQQTMIEDMRHNEAWKKYYDSTVMFAEIAEMIFVHGWIPCINNSWGKPLKYNPDWRNASYQEWKDATWLNGMAQWNEKIVESGKTILCGHWHTSWGHSLLHNEGSEYGENAIFKPFMDWGIIAIDGCIAYSGICNCVVFDITDEEWENRIIWNR